MKKQLNEIKRMQQLAGVISESELHELDADAAKQEFKKYLDAVAAALSKLDDAGYSTGLFKTDKEAEKKYNEFFDAFGETGAKGTAATAFGNLYKYVTNQGSPKID